MGDLDLDTQLTKYLTDAHSIEVQALAQVRTAPDIADEGTVARSVARSVRLRC